ncbi:MAG: sodium:solute symporter [Bacteroidetes bacterium]|nr:sodium:solute symporter [Bacteroidota bacterium]
MSTLDWLVFLGSQGLILAYGLWSMSRQGQAESYLRSRSQTGWMVGLSIMATQASAITFLSAPGLAYREGLGFIQFYLGLPLAMVVLSVVALPIYYRLNVYTAYEYLETRFDGRVRRLAAFLFLTQRGLAAGLTIYAPALILSTALGWDLLWTNLLTGSVVLAYTLSGGSRAVARTQLLQMSVILLGMVLAGWWMFRSLPSDWSGSDALQLSALAGKTQALVLRLDWNDRYSLWTGLVGGGFLMLSYFGTDQSQVQRYLGGQSLSQSRKGLMLNAFFKLPMQLMILGLGVLMYVFYVFETPPLDFKHPEKVQQADRVLFEREARHRLEAAEAWRASTQPQDKERWAQEFRQSASRLDSIRTAVSQQNGSMRAEGSDTNFIFIRYVLDFLPVGLVGLLISMVFCASMSSTAAELSALSTTTLVDFYARWTGHSPEGPKALAMGRIFTLAWGLYAVGFALIADRMGTLIEAVNVLGSLVYGTILGIFLSAFFSKGLRAPSVLLAALLTETLVLLLYFGAEIPYLWLNAVGALAVPLLGWIVQPWLVGLSSQSPKTPTLGS